MKRGDVVIVDFPFSDGTGRKVRPALIVQSDAKNQALDDTIIALITSRLHRRLDTHVVVDISTAEGKQSGLRINSAVQCENLVTVDQRLILANIGDLSRHAMADVDRCLRAALAL